MIMAKGFTDTDSLCRGIVRDAQNGIFKPVYLLMGDEPYYVDMVCDAILEHCLDESEKDFNQTVCYGADVSADAVITAARRYPMFAERQLVVVKEAQMMKGIEELAVYCQNPLESTVLVIAMHGASADKRKSLYKTVSKMGVVVESQALRDYDMPRWIPMYYQSRGLQIAPDAAALLAEHAGTDLNKIAIETEKMLKNLPEGTTQVTASDIEKNVGISCQFSIFELTKELSFKNSAKALRIAAYIGSAAKFAIPMAVSALYTHFYRILKYNALLMSDPRPANDQKAKVLGVNPYFFSEYDTAVRNYPVKKCMAVIALLKEYDFKGKGGEVGEATDAQLMVELTAKILNI
jgi:DNA polymerase-3 subunit delta